MAAILKGLGKGVLKFAGSILSLTLNSDGYISINGKRIYFLTTAIVANTTLLSATGTGIPVGSLAVTTHATGRSSIFVADATKWQYPTLA